MVLKFITNKPALLLDGILVISDLHIGIEYEFYKSGIRIPSNVEGMMKDLEEIINQTNAKRLVILGDVKHKVPGVTKQELREIPEFLSHFSEKIELDILPGNHDGNLREFVPKGIQIHPNKGFRIDEFYFLHGHTWPSGEFLKTKFVFVGHEHPQIELVDRIGYHFIEQVWIRARLDPEKIQRKYVFKGKLPELVILPRFNRLSGGISMNMPIRDLEKAHKLKNTGLGTLVRYSRLKEAKVYLLDGTFLGKMRDLM
jgi:hypothetical protein